MARSIVTAFVAAGFLPSRPDSSDANAPMRATRQGDTNIIRIGTEEVYEIPDALVVGG